MCQRRKQQPYRTIRWKCGFAVRKKVLDLLVSSDISVRWILSELDDNSYGTYTVPAKVVLRGFTEIGAVGTYEVPVYVS